MTRTFTTLVAAIGVAAALLPTASAEAYNSFDTEIATAMSTGAVGSESAVVMTDDGLPVIAALDETNDTIQVAICSDPACAGGKRFNVGTGISSADVDIALASDGSPVIAYSHISSDLSRGVRVVACSNAACHQSSTADLEFDYVGGFSNVAVAVRSDDTPVVSYSSLGSYVESYFVVSCNDRACSGSGEVSTFVAYWPWGMTADMTLGDDDRAILVMGRLDDGSARVYRCKNVACTSMTSELLDGSLWSPRIAERGGELAIVGSNGAGRTNLVTCGSGCDPAVAISPSAHGARFADVSFVGDGHPIVSYSDNGKRLWLVDCPNGCMAPTYLTRNVGGYVRGVAVAGGEDEAYITYFQRYRADTGLVHVFRPKKLG